MEFGNQTSTVSVAETSRLHTRTASRPGTSRPRTGRPRTALSTLAGFESQQIVCALSESRGVAPTVGLAFVNLDTAEAVLCQVIDTQTYVRTIQKLALRSPSELLIVKNAADPKSTLLSVVEETLDDLECQIILLDRRYYSENTGLEYINRLALVADLEAIKAAVAGSFFAICSFSAALRHVEGQHGKTFSPHSLRIKYEPSEGAMMIDLSTIYSLELIQNLHDWRSKECLYGVLNETQSPMGARLLRSNILQPLTSGDTIEARWDAVEELSSKQDVLVVLGRVLKGFVDVDRLLTNLVMVPFSPKIETTEQNINNVIMLRQFVSSVRPIHDALSTVESALLLSVREHCAPRNIDAVEVLVNSTINDDVRFSKNPLDLRYQRAFAIRSGVNGLLDASRTTFKEGSEDAWSYLTELKETHGLKFELKFDSKRQFYLRLPESELEDRELPSDCINVIRRKKTIECSTLSLMQQNQKIVDSHNECIMMSDEIVKKLICESRTHASALFKICESIAMLDMMSSFAHLAARQGYVRPEISETLGIQAGRHPIKELSQSNRFIPNDVYATRQRRFQIVTGCNMSGKSTYIRMVALMVVMAQVGCFVPAAYASFPIHHQLFARINVDDNMDANVSTFAAEMHEAAYILRNIDDKSLAIIDELGRGTSTRDGLAIAIAIAETLLQSGALIWFVTHYTDLAETLAERPGVSNLHLAVDSPDPSTLTMLYRVAAGPVATPSYGLALARLVPLPTAVLTHASQVASMLRQREVQRKTNSRAMLTQQQRRLILDLREHLQQARASSMEGEELRAWLKDLQRQFVLQTAQLEEQFRDADAEEEAEDESQGSFEPTEEGALEDSAASGKSQANGSLLSI